MLRSKTHPISLIAILLLASLISFSQSVAQTDLQTSKSRSGLVQAGRVSNGAIEWRATKPLSINARNSMFDLIGCDTNSNPEPVAFILVLFASLGKELTSAIQQCGRLMEYRS
jgi:hypothetical protein